MNWKKICLDSINEWFLVMDKQLKTKDKSKLLGINEKGDKTYKIDKIAENVYLKNLPDNVMLISEESEVVKSDKNYIAVIDPICGSAFAVRGSDFFETCISIFTKDMKSIFEAIGIYETREIYYANKSGAFHNRKRLRTAKTDKIENAKLNIELWSIKDRLAFFNSNLFKFNLNIFGLGIKTALCELAEGHIDAHITFAPTFPITELIGTFLIQQAGGVVTDINGNKIRLYPDNKHMSTLLCSANKKIHKAILENL